MLSKVIAENFLSWKKLQFTVSNGVTQIDGWNEDDNRAEGSGKSALVNTLCWVIYGKLPKEVNIDEVIKDGESGCLGQLEFDNGDMIFRSRKPNDLYLLKNGEIIKGKDSNETKAIIEEYIGCNFETFCQSVYFAQNYDKKFLTSNQADKGKILSSIQNLQIFDKARKETMELLKKENDNLTSLKNKLQIEKNNFTNFGSQKALLQSFIQDKIVKHQQQLFTLTQHRDMISGHVKKTMTDLDRNNQDILAIDLMALDKDYTDLNQAKAEYNTQLGSINHQKSQIDSIKRSIQLKEQEGESLAKKYQAAETKLKNINPTESARYKALEISRNSALNIEQNPSRNRLVAKIKPLQDFILNPTKNCPSCGTELHNQDTTHANAELTSILNEISEIESLSLKQADQYKSQMEMEVLASQEQAQQLNQEMASILEQLQVVSAYLDENKAPSADDLQSQETELRNVIRQIDQLLVQTQQKKMDHSRLTTQNQSLTAQLLSYEDQLKRAEQTISQLGEPDVSEDNAKLEKIDGALLNSSEALQELEQLIGVSTEHCAKLETLKEGFKEIKSHVFVSALNQLNVRANQYLNEIFDMEASIKFSSVDQDIETRITLNDKERSIGLLSGGQNRRFNLAVDLALADIVSFRNSSKLNVLILDEYFKDLSEISMEKSLDLLKTRKCPVIMIEHNSQFKSIVDNTFFVRLKNGTSEESKP